MMRRREEEVRGRENGSRSGEVVVVVVRVGDCRIVKGERS